MSTSRATTSKSLVTAIAFLDTRQILPGIVDVANEAGFDDLMMLTKSYKKTDQPNYHHFVNEDLFQVLVFDAGGVSGSGTTELTVTLTTTGFARRDNLVKFEDGKVGYINSAITVGSSKDSFTIKSVDGTNLTAVAGDSIAIIGLVGGEKSNSVQNLNYGQTKYFNLIQTMKDLTKITDIQKGSTVEVGGGNYMYIQAVNQAQAFKTQISAALVAGRKSVNEYGTASPTLTDQNGNSMQTTGGFDQEVTTYGVNDAVATPDVVVSADLDDLCDRLLAVKGYNNYMNLCPDKPWRKYDDYFKNLNSSGVTSAQLNVNGKDFDFNVSNWTKGKFTFQFGSMPIGDHPQIFNFTGSSSIGKNIYGVPTSKVKTQGGGMENRVGVRYIPNQAASKGRGTEIIQELYTGGLAPNPTSAEQVCQVDWTTHQGLECLGTRQMFKQTVLA
jgi:hypothetical protein